MRLLFFAQLKDAAGCAAADWTDVGPLNAEELWQRLILEFPGLAAHRDCVRLARNGAYAAANELFHPDDEVALIPPVSGG